MAIDSINDEASMALLRQANQQADAGHAEPAMAFARALLARAEQAQDTVMCAEAMLCLACCELRLLGKFAKAIDLAQRAALLFQRVQHAMARGARWPPRPSLPRGLAITRWRWTAPCWRSRSRPPSHRPATR
nr:hypothetical protein [uncultured Roseateles sp.]